MVDSDATAVITTSAVSAWIIRLMRDNPKVAVINPNSVLAPHAFSVLFAVLSAAGIHFAFDQATGVLTIGGLTAGNLLHVGYDVFKSFVMNSIMLSNQNGKPDGGKNA